MLGTGVPVSNGSLNPSVENTGNPHWQRENARPLRFIQNSDGRERDALFMSCEKEQEQFAAPLV